MYLIPTSTYKKGGQDHILTEMLTSNNEGWNADCRSNRFVSNGRERPVLDGGTGRIAHSLCRSWASSMV